MKRVKITLVKSVIDRPETAKRTIAALGLKKMNATVEVEATPQILGMIRRVAHLIKVEDVQVTEKVEDVVSVSEAPVDIVTA
jgi:large subunit ribosomal protein L30